MSSRTSRTPVRTTSSSRSARYGDQDESRLPMSTTSATSSVLLIWHSMRIVSNSSRSEPPLHERHLSTVAVDDQAEFVRDERPQPDQRQPRRVLVGQDGDTLLSLQ